MKKRWIIAIMSAAFLGQLYLSKEVEAKIAFTSNTNAFQQNPDNGKPSVLSEVTTLNLKMINYFWKYFR